MMGENGPVGAARSSTTHLGIAEKVREFKKNQSVTFPTTKITSGVNFTSVLVSVLALGMAKGQTRSGKHHPIVTPE